MAVGCKLRGKRARRLLLASLAIFYLNIASRAKAARNFTLALVARRHLNLARNKRRREI